MQQSFQNMGDGHFAPIVPGHVREREGEDLRSPSTKPALEGQKTQKVLEAPSNQRSIESTGNDGLITG